MFTNDPQLNNALLLELKDIVNKLTEKILRLLRESIQTEVYEAGTPNVYHRNEMFGGLPQSFQQEGTNITGQIVQDKIYQDTNIMVEHIPGDKSDFVHGSEYYDPQDIRKFLTTIIIEGSSGPLFGSGFWTQRRDFWQPLIDMLADGTIDTLLESEFRSRGIKFIKV